MITQILTDGSPVTPEHREINPATGQQNAYVVLTVEERAKGFVRPVRRTYIHKPCGTITTMATSIAETYARDPSFYAGTKTIDEGGAKAMRDLMDKWLIMRTESNALVALLINKGVFTAEDFTAQVGIEAGLLDKSLEQVFEGFRTIPAGIEIYDAKLAAETTRKLGFPP